MMLMKSLLGWDGRKPRWAEPLGYEAAPRTASPPLTPYRPPMHSTTTSPCSQAKFKDATLTSGTRGEHCATNMNTTKPLGTPSSRREDIDMITPKLALSVAPVTIHTTPFKCSLNSNSDEDDSDLRSTSLPRMLGENVNAVNLTRCGSSAGLQSAGVHEKQALVMPARTPGTPPFSFRADASASANADCKCDGDADADGGASNERTDDSKGCPCARQQQRQGVMRSSAIISQSKTTKENEAKSGLSGSLPPSRRAKKAVTFAVQVQCEDWNKAKPEFGESLLRNVSSTTTRIKARGTTHTTGPSGRRGPDGDPIDRLAGCTITRCQDCQEACAHNVECVGSDRVLKIFTPSSHRGSRKSAMQPCSTSAGTRGVAPRGHPDSALECSDDRPTPSAACSRSSLHRSMRAGEMDPESRHQISHAESQEDLLQLMLLSAGPARQQFRHHLDCQSQECSTGLAYYAVGQIRERADAITKSTNNETTQKKNKVITPRLATIDEVVEPRIAMADAEGKTMQLKLMFALRLLLRLREDTASMEDDASSDQADPDAWSVATPHGRVTLLHLSNGSSSSLAWTEKTIAQSQSLSPDESSTSLPSPSPLAFCPFRTASPLPLALLRASSGTTQLLCTAFPQNAPLQQQQQQHHSVQHPRGSLSGIRFSSDVEDTACERELPIISLTTPDLKTVLVIQPSNRARSSIAATAKTKTTLQADSGDPNIYQAQKSPTGSTASPLSSPSRQVFMSAQNSDGAVEAGKLKDLPAFELADWPTRKSDAGHSSNSTSTASTCTPSPEDHFLTPRAGSPFFPTSFSGLPPGLTSASHQESSPKAEAYVLAPSDTSSIVSSQETLTIQSLAEPDSNTGLQSMRDASALGSIDTQSTASSSQAGPSKVQGCPSDNPSAGLGWSSDSVQSHSPKLAVRASYDASSSAPLQESQSTSPIATSWPEQLRASLVQEGLTETALTAEQEIQSLVAGATVPAAGLDALASNGPTSPHSQAQEDASKMASSSSDISRTPSTSTTCSIATSQASAETAPSSVPSEADGVESKFEIENLSAESFAPSTLLADERNSQSKIRRYHALLELVETERSYTNDLSVLVHVYLETLPLQPYFEDHPARVETVVRNTPELLNIHNDIAGFLEEILEREGISVNDPGDDIEKAMSKGVGIAISEIGTFFCNLSQRLTAYQDFCARHAETLAIIREAERRHNGDDFAAFERLCSNILRSRPGSAYSSTTEVNRLSRQSSYSVLGATTTSPAVRTAPLSPLTSIPSELPDALHGAIVAPRSNSNGGKQQGGRLKFADLLIKPVQRLCLYPLVLHTLLKHTGPDDVGKEELQAAMATMKTVADQVDAAGRRREQFLISELVASRLDPQPPVTKALLSRIGPLELSGTLDLLYHHFQIAPLVAPLRFRFLGLFLYHHWLLVVKLGKSGSYVPRHWFPLHQAELSSINEGEGALPHAFRLTVNHEHHFELAASSSKEMAMWVDKLATGIALATEDDGPKLPSSLSDAHDTAVLSALDRSCDVTTRSRSRADSNSDPLRDFLVHQSAVATSAEVLVRYATLNQRANVDRGMVFSDAILGARAVAQKDGSYTPGGSLTKNSPGSTQSPTPTGSTSTVNLTSWHAATNNTSSLGAAVGAAMGFARAAKRSSRQSVTNAFEAAAQQYLANEEQRLAEENKAAQQLAWQRNSPSGTRGESDAANSASATLNTSRPGYSSRRKRASFAIGSSARPLSTIFTSSGTSIRTPSPANETGLLSSPLTSPSPTTLDSFSPESVVSPDRSPGQSAQGSRLKRRQSGSSGAALRDAIASAGAWSRRTRSRSSEIDSGRLAAMHFSTPAGEQLASPQSAVFSINSSDAGRSSTYPESPEEAGDVTFPASARTTASAPATRPPSIRHTMSALTPVRRERSRTIASPEEERASLTAFPFESSERRGLDIQGAAWPEQPALQPPQRRRTTSSFGSLIGPPLGSLKRNLSFNRKSPMGFGSRSEASSRRSSVIDSSEAISEDHIATGPYNAPASSSQASLESRRGSKGVFGRSATDTDLLPSHSESQKALKTSTKSSSRSQSQDTSSALKSLGKAPSRAQPQASAAATATTALADVKVKGSMSSGSFLTRSLSKRFTFNSTSESTDSTGRASRPLSLRRFTSNASQQREMPTPLAEETERSSYEFGKLDDETVAASSKAA